MTKDGNCINSCHLDHFLNVSDIEFASFKRHLIFGAGIEERRKSIGLQGFQTNILYSNEKQPENICDLCHRKFGTFLTECLTDEQWKFMLNKCSDGRVSSIFVECIETVTVKSLQEALCIREKRPHKI